MAPNVPCLLVVMARFHPFPLSVCVTTYLVAQMVKRLPTMWETQVWPLGCEDPLEKEMATHSSTLAWKIPWMEDRGRLQSTGSQRVEHDWTTSLSLSLSVVESSDLLLINCCFSVTKSCSTFCDPVDWTIPDVPILHYLPELAQTHVRWVGDAIQPSHPLSSPSSPAFNLSQNQGLF